MTTIVSNGFNTLHMMPKELLAYFRLISLEVNSLITNRYCLIFSFFLKGFFTFSFFLFRFCILLLTFGFCGFPLCLVAVGAFFFFTPGFPAFFWGIPLLVLTGLLFFSLVAISVSHPICLIILISKDTNTDFF